MSFDLIAKEHADQLLQDLCNFREKLLRELSRSAGNLEETSSDATITKLAEVQGCIQAAREYLDEHWAEHR